MTINFENDKDVIVYALEKIICYARDNRYTFVGQSVWWIASVIGLVEGLATHIDNLRIRFEAGHLVAEEDHLPVEKDLRVIPQKRICTEAQDSYIHPDRLLQVDRSSGNPEAKTSQAELDRASLLIQGGNKFVNQSRKDRRALKQRPCVLSRTRSGKVPIKNSKQKQRKRL